jgi:mycothiol synthase
MSDPFTPQLAMRRDTLDGLPALLLPEGYTLRTYCEGDDANWIRIINESFERAWTKADFASMMKNDPAFRPERLFFVVAPDGVPCATAGAWRSATNGEGVGYLHYVGTRPAHAGRKLGYWVSLAALLHLRAEGCNAATLLTDDYRLAAIKTYLRLGFRPVIVHENQPTRWERVMEVIGDKVMG